MNFFYCPGLDFSSLSYYNYLFIFWLIILNIVYLPWNLVLLCLTCVFPKIIITHRVCSCFLIILTTHGTVHYIPPFTHTFTHRWQWLLAGCHLITGSSNHSHTPRHQWRSISSTLGFSILHKDNWTCNLQSLRIKPPTLISLDDCSTIWAPAGSAGSFPNQRHLLPWRKNTHLPDHSLDTESRKSRTGNAYPYLATSLYNINNN